MSNEESWLEIDALKNNSIIKYQMSTGKDSINKNEELV